MKTDVLVVGDGPSAVAAAVTAGRMGAKTTLMLPRYSRIQGGGLSRRGKFEWRGSASSDVWEEVRERMGRGSENGELCDPESLAAVLNEMVGQAKVEVIGKYLISADRPENGDIRDILVSGSTHRPMRISAKVYIDSTGTALLAREAGIPCENTELKPGDPVSVGLEIRLRTARKWAADVLMNAQDAFVRELQAQMDEAGAEFEIDSLRMRRIRSLPDEGFSLIEVRMSGWTGYSMFGWEGGEKAAQMAIRYLRERAEALEGAELIEARRYKGLERVSDCRGIYRLTEQDICKGRVFEDWVVSGARCGFDSESLGDMQVEAPEYDGREYTIPYGCLLPEGCGNLLLSGRGICATDMARRSISSAPIAFAIGEAAGAAAALAVRKKCAPKELNVEDIQLERMNRGAKNPGNMREC